MLTWHSLTAENLLVYFFLVLPPSGCEQGLEWVDLFNDLLYCCRVFFSYLETLTTYIALIVQS
jgi:hypothetical protein